MKAFERALRRSALPMAYSQGFNPHPLMVFGLPLSVGVTSEAEYADFELLEKVNPREFAERLNMQLPRGLKVTAAAEKLTRNNIMATVSMASYAVLVGSPRDTDLSSVRKNIKELLAKSEIMVQKETKKGLKEVNIRPMIHRLEALEVPCGEFKDSMSYGKSKDGMKDTCTNDFIINYARRLANESAMLKDETAMPKEESAIQKDEAALPKEKDVPDLNDQNLFCLSMLLDAGSGSNLKPELLFEALKAGGGILTKLLKIHRTGLFVVHKGQIKDPLDPAVLKM